ncbi:hypothetical protein [Amycolatopsis suaedae]|uniref:Uncharacterized protein n=1 Tax=Amycolatopsis suaedae TaxID=2510978 RepID=A0A4Q7J1N6_9PSEU|nr:hypothetical protein [Amycolatopsis suaedae]RZQ60648.1 hypothetical protein EWH70_28725 [Amycolatopsis suaedae]
MDTNAYVVFLVLGVLLVVADGQIIYRSGRRYLEHSYGDATASASMTRLITVLFHLAVLGLLALLSTVDFGNDSLMEAVVAKLGVLLLVLAAAHGVTLLVLSRIRDNRIAESGLPPAQADRQRGSGAVVTPAPGQPGADPRVSPSLDRGGPYSTPET